MQCFMLYRLKKANKKYIFLEARQTLKILGAAISSHLVSFQFLLISGHFRTSPENETIVQTILS